jgi:hypothetical protein
MPERTSHTQTNAEREADRQALDDSLNARSRSESAVRIRSVLAISCPVCGAAKAAYCIPNAKGFCKERWERGADLLRFPGALEPGDLAPAAQIVRNVALHAAQKAHDSDRRERMPRLSGGVR